VASAHKTIYGIGPGKIFSDISKNVVGLIMTQCLTALEKSLLDEGRVDIISDVRKSLFARKEHVASLEAIARCKLLEAVVRVHADKDTVYSFLIFENDLITS